jgi:triacylglycerol lipase
MRLVNQFFENPAEWVSAYNERTSAYQTLIDTQRSKRKETDGKYAAELAVLAESFSKEIATSEEELSKVAPISASEVEGIPSRRAAYSDRMSALMAKMSLLAYIAFEDDDKRRILENTLKHGGLKLVTSIAVDDTEMFLAEGNDFLVASFRGTTSKRDRKTDLSIYTEQVEVVGHPKHVFVHKGFYEAYMNVEGPVREALLKIEKKPIYLTGHSLGGAVALVASAALGGHDILGERVAATYTFGAPRVGGPDFANVVKAPHYRVVNSGDAIPLVPPNWIRGYRHTGQPSYLKKGATRPGKRAPLRSAVFVGLASILLWPFSRQLLFLAAHDISRYATSLDNIARYRGRWT